MARSMLARDSHRDQHQLWQRVCQVGRGRALGRALDTRTTAILDCLFRKDFFCHLFGIFNSAKYFCITHAVVQSICFLFDTCSPIVVVYALTSYKS